MNSQLVQRIIEEIGKSHAHLLLLAVLKWAALGACAGLAVSVFSTFIFHKLGWYRSAWKHAKWVRWLLWLVTVGAVTVLAGTAGFWKGAVQESEQVLMKSQLGTEVLPVVGDTLADGVAALHVLLTDPAGSDSRISNQITAFRAGTWELDAQKFVTQLDRVRTDTVSNLVQSLEAELVRRNPSFQAGLPNKVLHQTLGVFGAALAQNKFDSELKRLGVEPFYHALREKLVAEARRHNAPETISHHEISALLVKEGVMPAVLRPIRSFGLTQFLLFLVLAGCCMVLAPVLFHFTCGRVKAAAASTPLAPTNKTQFNP
jgi:hypothetical protein